MALSCICANVQVCPIIKHSNSEEVKGKCRRRRSLWRQQMVAGIERSRQMRGTGQSIEEQFPISCDRSAGVAGQARSWERYFRRPTERPFTAEERDRVTILFGGTTTSFLRPDLAALAVSACTSRSSEWHWKTPGLVALVCCCSPKTAASRHSRVSGSLTHSSVLPSAKQQNREPRR